MRSDRSPDAPTDASSSPRLGRRTLGLLVAVILVGAPAGLLRTACVGDLCRQPDERADVPFCSLPDGIKERIAAGFRDGRSPDALGVTGSDAVAGSHMGSAEGPPGSAGRFDDPWPSTRSDTRVPLVFAGTGVTRGARVPVGTTLDAVAPTVADVIGLERAHPEVRSGRTIPGVATGERPRLVLEVVYKGIGSGDLLTAPRDWPNLAALLGEGGGTLDADTGSLPTDPAAVLTTIGTGGLPFQHGITGAFVRNDRGHVVPAWGADAPVSVIATIGDDLDEVMGQRPKIGLVAIGPADRGVIGADWYLDVDRDDVALAGPGRIVPTVRRILARGYGDDDVPDMLAVATRGSVSTLDDHLGRLVALARDAADGSVAVVVTSTGTGPARGAGSIHAQSVVDQVEAAAGAAVDAAVPGGLFLDPDALADAALSTRDVVSALAGVRDDGGAMVFADTFPKIAVAFARYC